MLHFRGERDAILTAVSAASRAATATRYGIPSMSLQLEKNNLTATGSDSDLIIAATTKVSGESDGTVDLPPRLTVDVIRALSAGEVTVESGESETRITSGTSEFNLRNLTTSRLLPLFEVDSPAVDVAAAPFAEALRQVVRAALSDDSRAPQLTGILVQHTETGVRLVATDSYRMAIRDLDGVSISSEADKILIPARSLAELQRSTEDIETISISHTGTAAKFVAGAVTISTRLIAGAFPDYERLIPSTYTASFRCERVALNDAISRVRVMLAGSKDGSVPVRFQFEQNRVVLNVVTAENGTVTDEVDGKLDGEVLSTAFNPAYFSDGLDAITSSDVTVNVIDNSKPALVVGDDDAYRYLCMPVRTS